MIERHNKDVQRFLSNFKHELGDDEQLLHLMKNKPPYSSVWIFVGGFIMISGVAYVNNIGYPITRFPALFLVLILIMIILFVVMFVFLKSDHVPPIRSSFGLITSKGIRARHQFIHWKLVYDIKIRYISGRRYLIFDLSPNRTEYELHNRSTTNSFVTGSFAFLGDQYDADHLFSEIKPFWEPQSPKQRLNNISKHLINTYQFSDSNSSKTRFNLTGDYKTFKINCSFDKSFPIKETKANLQLPKPIPAYLKIGMESGTTTFKQAISGKDIQIGHPIIDSQCLFESSHPDALQQLFTADFTKRFLQLLQLGTVIWIFGTPVKQKRLKETSSIEDDEAVLDIGLAQSNKKANTRQVNQLPVSKRLEFFGQLNDKFKNSPEKAAAFIELCIGITVILGVHLIKLEENT